MPKLAKVALIIAIAAVAIATKQFISPDEQKLASAVSATSGASISPAELTRAVGVLPETKIDSPSSPF